MSVLERIIVLKRRTHLFSEARTCICDVLAMVVWPMENRTEICSKEMLGR